MADDQQNQGSESGRISVDESVFRPSATATQAEQVAHQSDNVNTVIGSSIGAGKVAKEIQEEKEERYRRELNWILASKSVGDLAIDFEKWKKDFEAFKQVFAQKQAFIDIDINNALAIADNTEDSINTVEDIQDDLLNITISLSDTYVTLPGDDPYSIRIVFQHGDGTYYTIHDDGTEEDILDPNDLSLIDNQKSTKQIGDPNNPDIQAYFSTRRELINAEGVVAECQEECDTTKAKLTDDEKELEKQEKQRAALEERLQKLKEQLKENDPDDPGYKDLEKDLEEATTEINETAKVIDVIRAKVQEAFERANEASSKAADHTYLRDAQNNKGFSHVDIKLDVDTNLFGDSLLDLDSGQDLGAGQAQQDALENIAQMPTASSGQTDAMVHLPAGSCSSAFNDVAPAKGVLNLFKSGTDVSGDGVDVPVLEPDAQQAALTDLLVKLQQEYMGAGVSYADLVDRLSKKGITQPRLIDDAVSRLQEQGVDVRQDIASAFNATGNTIGAVQAIRTSNKQMKGPEISSPFNAVAGLAVVPGPQTDLIVKPNEPIPRATVDISPPGQSA